jgi:hypothetical protein
MKHKTSLAALAAVIALAVPAFSQTNWGSTGAVTVALTLTYEAEALLLKDETGKVLTVANGGGPTFENNYSVETYIGTEPERVLVKTVTTQEYGSKLLVAKWGNAEIIKLLVEDGTLPKIGKSPFLAGWSIMETVDSTGLPLGIVARHTNKTTVPIDLMITGLVEGLGTSVSATSSKTVITDNSPPVGEPTMTETRTLTDSYKSTGFASVPFFEAPIEVTGLLTGGSKVTPKTEGTGLDKITTFVFTNNATKLDKILGELLFEDVGHLVEGSISIAAGVIVDLDAFNPGVP